MDRVEWIRILLIVFVFTTSGCLVGLALDSEPTPDNTITITNNNGAPLTATPNASENDADDDGVPNSFERKLGTDPNTYNANLNSTIEALNSDANLSKREREWIKYIFVDNPHNIGPQVLEQEFHADGSITEKEMNNSIDHDSDGAIRKLEKEYGTNIGDKDTDGDGLYDGWEIRKRVSTIPAEERESNTVEKRNMANQTVIDNADPLHKDVYIYVYEEDGKLTQSHRKSLENLYSSVGINNPEGTNGVRLHWTFHRGESPNISNVYEVENESYYGVYHFAAIRDIDGAAGHGYGYQLEVDPDHTIDEVFDHELSQHLLAGKPFKTYQRRTDPTHRLGDDDGIQNEYSLAEINRDGFVSLPPVSDRERVRQRWNDSVWWVE